MQHHLLALLYVNLIEQIRDYKKYILLLVMPAALMVFIMMGSLVSEEQQEEESIIHVGLQMDMENIYGNILKSSFFSADHFDDFIHVDEVDADEAQVADYDAYIQVPSDFFEALMYFEHAPVIVSIGSDNPVVTYLVSGVMNSYGNYIRSVEASVVSLYDVMKVSGFDQEQRLDYNERIAFKLIKMLLNRDEAVDTETVGRYANMSETAYVYIAFMVFFIWLICLFIGIKWLESDHKVLLERYLISGHSMFLYIFAYYLAIAFCLFIVTSIWHFVAFQVLGTVEAPSKFLYLLTLVIIGFDLSVVLLVANIIRNKNQLILIFGSLGLVLCVAGGTIIPIYEMSPIMLSVAKLTPNYWMIQTMSSAFVNEQLSEIIIFSIIFLCLAVIINFSTALVIRRQWER